MLECCICLLNSSHPFGFTVDEKGICSGCNAHLSRRASLQCCSAVDFDKLDRSLCSDFGQNIKDVIVPLQFDNEAHFVIDSVLQMGMRPTVVYFNAQYHDQLTFNYLSQLQELYDVDFIGLSLPKQILQKLVVENIVGGGNPRKFEIIGQYAAALYVAKQLNIDHIISGPLQSSEVVGNISSKFPTRLSFSEFIDRIVVHDLSDYELEVLRGSKSSFSSAFEIGSLKELFKTVTWRFLGDYIFWDSVTINKSYADRYKFSARFEEGYGEEFQTVSSSLKLGEFDLLRILNGRQSRILSYLNRDIRNQTINRKNAKDTLEAFLNKEWRLSGLAEFLEVSETNVHDLFSILMKKSSIHYTVKKTSDASPIYNHSQLIM